MLTEVTREACDGGSCLSANPMRNFRYSRAFTSQHEMCMLQDNFCISKKSLTKNGFQVPKRFAQAKTKQT